MDELRQMIQNYRPSEHVLAGMKDIRVFGTVGPSASGKTTLMARLAKKSSDFKFILDETSRPPRPAEVDGVDFLFRTRDAILSDLEKGELVQLALGPNGDLYSTRLSSFPNDAVGLIALVPLGVIEFRRLPIRSITTAFIVPASFEVWQQWLAKQAKVGSWTEEKMQSRLAEAKVSYKFALNDKAMRFVLNDDLGKATDRLEQAARGQTPDNEDMARQTAAQNYHNLLKL